MSRLLALFASAALLSQAQTVLKHTFNSDTEGWITMGTSGSVRLSPEAKSGEGALQFSYSLDGKGFSSAILPAGAGKLAEMRRIRFWVKADHDTALGIILAEKKPGGDYSALFWAPKNVWQPVELSLSSFIASDGPNDPVDPDGKLDPDQVEGIGIIDFAAFLNQLPPDSPMFVSKATGAHSILIDDFEILGGGGGEPAPTKPGTVLIDSFDRGFSEWITLGGMDLKLSPGDNPIGGPALEASIHPVEGKLALLMRRTNPAALAGSKRIAFDIAAEHEGAFAISIETKKNAAGQGPRYNFMIYPPGERKVFRVNVSLADFEHDANSPGDAAGTLEASSIKSIAIGDVTALSGGAATGNRIWIGRVEMLK